MILPGLLLSLQCLINMVIASIPPIYVLFIIIIFPSVAPTFISNMTLIENAAGEIILYVIIKASKTKLRVAWYIDNSMQSSIEREVSLTGQVKVIRSEILLRNVPTNSIHITAVATNTDRDKKIHTGTITTLVVTEGPSAIGTTCSTDNMTG